MWFPSTATTVLTCLKSACCLCSNITGPFSARNTWLGEMAARFKARCPSPRNITSPPLIGDSSPARRRRICRGIPGSIPIRIVNQPFGFTKFSAQTASPTAKRKPISSGRSPKVPLLPTDCANRLRQQTTCNRFVLCDRSPVDDSWRRVAPRKGRDWFRDVDSNHDTQLQRLMSYRLDDPGTADNSLAEEKECAKPLKCARCESFC